MSNDSYIFNNYVVDLIEMDSFSIDLGVEFFVRVHLKTKSSSDNYLHYLYSELLSMHPNVFGKASYPFMFKVGSDVICGSTCPLESPRIEIIPSPSEFYVILTFKVSGLPEVGEYDHT